MYIHTYTYAYIHTYAHVHIYANTFIYAHMCSYAYMHARMYMQLCLDACAHAQSDVRYSPRNSRDQSFMYNSNSSIS
jgi:hypothetical protein